MAEEERERIRKRQRKEIDVALQNGLVFGRPKVIGTEDVKQAYDLWKSKEITAMRAMQEIGVKRRLFIS
jgi:DNA invertase Pin-like site-specific DNA recombinase